MATGGHQGKHDRKTVLLCFLWAHVVTKVRGGVKNNYSYEPVRKRWGGGANPLAVIKIGFFSDKDKKMQNVLKRKICKNIL